MPNTAQETPAKAPAQAPAAPDKPSQSTRERKNLALQLEQARGQELTAAHAAAAPNISTLSRQEPLLEQAPESERSEALSMPVSEGDTSARQQFN